MALRNPWGSNGPYNPSEWGLVSGGSPQLPGGQFVQAQRPNTQVQPNPHADYDGEPQPPVLDAGARSTSSFPTYCFRSPP